MPAYWTKKDERKYKAIVKSCTRYKRRGRTLKVCKRIAAATVNRDRGYRKGKRKRSRR